MCEEMALRTLAKMNFANDGSRSLFVSTNMPVLVSVPRDRQRIHAAAVCAARTGSLM
jgi:hypothetical protein